MSRAALDRVVARFPEAVLETHDFRGDETAIVRRATTKDVLRFLRDDEAMRFDLLADLTCVDYLGRTPRF